MPEKVYMDYEELKAVCLGIVDNIQANGDEFDEIIAVTRGGLTPAHIMAKQMRLDVGIFAPKHDNGQFPAGRLSMINDDSKKILIVEDLIALGRTFDVVEKYMDYVQSFDSEFEWEYCPILIDDSYTKRDFKYFGFRSHNWIVFPYENEDSVVVGDRGLHRDRSDMYGRE